MGTVSRTRRRGRRVSGEWINMAGSNYLPFEVAIAGSFDSGFTVKATTPTGGSRELDLELPWSASELEERVGILSEEAAGRKMGTAVGESRVDVKGLGSNLFDAIFHGGVRDLLRASQSRSDYSGVRIRFRLDAADLADVPWEYIFDQEADRFLGLSRTTPIVRTFNLTTPMRTPLVTDQLNVLVMVSSAGGDNLATEEEFTALESALAHEPAIRLKRSRNATLDGLIEELDDGEFHIFHFIGHGRYDDRATTGQLLFEDANGEADGVSAESLAVHLGDHPSLRLIVLNACEGARASVADPTSGMAQSLFTGGIEAVVAMQFEITDAAALTFSRQMYRSIGDREPIERAVTEARKAVPVEGREWATPVLFMRSSDGHLFEERETPEVELPDDEPVEPQPPATDAADSSQVGEDPTAKPTRGRALVALAGAVIVALAIVVGFIATRGDSNPQAAAVTEPQLDPIFETTSSTQAATTSVVPVTVVGEPAGTEQDHRDEPTEAPFDGAVAWFDVVVGDCLDDVGAIEANYEGDYWVSVVPCTGTDDEFTFARFDMGLQAFLDGEDVDNPWPGDVEIFDRASTGCESEFDGLGLETDGYILDTVYPLTPTADDWDAAERFFAVCTTF